MQKEPNNFELNCKDGLLKVQEHAIAGQTIFRVLFSNKRAPLMIAKAEHANAHYFWTSIPEGRQKEAEEIGV